MGLRVTFVSGPRRSGKSVLIHSLISGVWKSPPHYIRLTKSGSDKQPPPKQACKPSEEKCPVASARWLEYKDDEIFAVLPEALSSIHKQDRFGTVVIEADADPTLRCAYPYDHRVFVMPLPGTVHEVFRDTSHAATELRRVLDDTAAFASEIFGLFERDDGDCGGPSEERSDLTATGMRGFLYSPLGDELATRIQLQQPYHGLVESDVIVVNSAVRQREPETDECMRRVSRLLARIRGANSRQSEMFVCDLTGPTATLDKNVAKALKPMGVGGR